jgi:hypothetical protein
MEYAVRELSFFRPRPATLEERFRFLRISPRGFGI